MKRIKSHLILLSLLLLGLTLRFFYLGEKSLWLDEACSLYQAQKPLPLLIKEAFFYDLHPPLYSILLHYWIKIGDGEFILRSLSAIIGFLSLIAFYKLAQLILNKEEAHLAFCFFTFSALAIFFSQELRPYSLFLFESILVSYLFLKNLFSDSKRYLLFYIVIGIMSIYTHLYTALLFLTHLFYVISFKKDARKKICEVFFSIAAIGLFFLPWWPAVTSKSCLFKGEWKKGIFLPGLREALVNLNFHLDIIPPALGLILTGAFILIIVFIITRQKDIRKEVYFPLCCFILPLLIVLLYPFRIHRFNIKEVVFISPFWYIILAWSISKLKRLYKTAVVVIWLFANIVTLSIYYRPDFIKENWREAASYIECAERKGEAVIFNPSYLGFPFDYYYRGNLLRGKIDSRMEAEALRKRYASVFLIESSSYLAAPLRESRLLIESIFKEKETLVWRGYLGDIVITKFY